MNLFNLYKTNERFKKYVDKYCVKHEIPVEVALQHLLIKQIAESI